MTAESAAVALRGEVLGRRNSAWSLARPFGPKKMACMIVSNDAII
ncbi:hypothetical protein [Desulfobacterium sp. N47]